MALSAAREHEALAEQNSKLVHRTLPVKCRAHGFKIRVLRQFGEHPLPQLLVGPPGKPSVHAVPGPKLGG